MLSPLLTLCASVLRLAYMQRSSILSVSGAFVQARCSIGKWRVTSTCPPFEWAMPLFLWRAYCACCHSCRKFVPKAGVVGRRSSSFPTLQVCRRWTRCCGTVAGQSASGFSLCSRPRRSSRSVYALRRGIPFGADDLEFKEHERDAMWDWQGRVTADGNRAV